MINNTQLSNLTIIPTKISKIFIFKRKYILPPTICHMLQKKTKKRPHVSCPSISDKQFFYNVDLLIYCLTLSQSPLTVSLVASFSILRSVLWHKSGHQSSPRPEIAIKSGLLKLSNFVSQYLLLLSFQMPMPFDFLLNVKINVNWNYLKIYNYWLIWHGETLDFNSNIMFWTNMAIKISMWNDFINYCKIL